jgi:hypothetical protein
MKIAILAVALSVGAFGNAVFNGDFQTGDLSGWTTFTTGNGVIGTPTVVSFDTTGSGPSLAAQLNVGEVTFTQNQEGGGLQQNVTLAAGSYSFFANIAATSTLGNSEYGVFSILMDGIVEDTTDLGTLQNGGTLLGTLSASFTVATSGSHQLEILITRPFVSDNSTTPFQYLDNIAINSTSAPEPASLMLGALGMAGLALARWRKG